MTTQAEMDALVARIRVLVDRHGGQSPVLAIVRRRYRFWLACPGDPAARAFVERAVEACEEGT